MPASHSPRSVVITALFVILLLLFAYSIADILFLLFIAVLFSLYLSAITDFVEQRFQVRRMYGLLAALLLTTAGMIGIGWLIVPPVLEQIQGLMITLPQLIAGLETDLLHLARRFPFLDQIMPRESAGGYVGSLVTWVGGYFEGFFPYVFTGLHVLINLVSVLVMGIYLTMQPEGYREGAVALVPPVHRDLARDIFDDLGVTLRAWIVGQILSMLVLTLLTYIGLLLLGVPYALAFAVFTGIAAIVPFFGTLVSTLLPALFVLGSGGPFHALLVALLGLVIHLIEGNFVHPIIMARQVHLPPVLSILSVLVMAKLLGVIGLLVAVPALATTMVIVRRIYVERILEGKGFRRSIRSEDSDLPLVRTSSPLDAASLLLPEPGRE
jgi:predicted PurR-regulated permease PerM